MSDQIDEPVRLIRLYHPSRRGKVSTIPARLDLSRKKNLENETRPDFNWKCRRAKLHTHTHTRCPGDKSHCNGPEVVKKSPLEVILPCRRQWIQKERERESRPGDRANLKSTSTTEWLTTEPGTRYQRDLKRYKLPGRDALMRRWLIWFLCLFKPRGADYLRGALNDGEKEFQLWTMIWAKLTTNLQGCSRVRVEIKVTYSSTVETIHEVVVRVAGKAKRIHSPANLMKIGIDIMNFWATIFIQMSLIISFV